MCIFRRKDIRKGIEFSSDEVEKIKEVYSRLKYWINLVKEGTVGQSDNLKSIIMDLANTAEELYNYYVPPFTTVRTQLTEDELQSVIKDIQSKRGMEGWLRLDGEYYTTDMDSLKRIIDWDWTDTRKYITDTFDCDKFAFYFKSRMAIDFGINAVGVILDYSARHAYNLLIVKDSSVKWYLYEPQNDNIFTYDTRAINMYRMEYYLLVM
jgi:hypothetical protein